ncbi:hypothetical protein EJ02DRAFT_392024 [Clathrospora elynae]|uniref:Uncharacterized protein n=1 Tax=Clathrospora elynae TaxID=706981 RepID=A0A6A5T4L8_9PLEO|nr:hypothetical protein EJ02DRAFT_392024 [Clathrospora elynae]
MANSALEAYSDSATNSPKTPPIRDVSPSSSDSSMTIKPLPAPPRLAPSYSDQEPYLDEPATPPANHDHTASPRPRNHSRHTPYRPYTDAPSPPQTPNADDVPLAHLLLHTRSHSIEALHPHNPPYPLEAPPSYAIAVRQSYRNTLIQHIARGQGPRDPVLVEVDEESGVELTRPDDVRHSIEKVVAMFIVATLLLIIAGVMGWMALGSAW